MKPKLKVIKNINILDADAYEAINHDPQMQLMSRNQNKGLRLKAGSYYIFLDMKIIEGEIINPVLYVDSGKGISEASDSKIRGTLINKDKWVFHFVARKGVRFLRLDPTESVCKFSIEDIALISAFQMNLRHAVSAFSKLVTSRSRASNKNDSIAAKSIIHQPDVSGKNYYKEYMEEKSKLNMYLSEYGSREYAAKDGRYYYEYAGLATDPLGKIDSKIKSIAFYLPQMHPIPENDKWWGRGFTEWTNVSKGVARFIGHYQPRLPGELGFYDLRCIDTIRRQVELANIYGLDAFCFYYYWFDGKRLLQSPLDMFCGEKSLNIDFCICWANENWTRRWDGLEADVLIAQKHSEEDSRAVFWDWVRYFEDERYIKIAGKPVLLIYRPDLIPEFEKTSLMWQDLAREAGFQGLYIVAANAFGNKDLSVSGLDALYEFPPHNIRVPHIDGSLAWFHAGHGTHAFSYPDAVKFAEAAYDRPDEEDGLPIHPGVLVGWDTEARKPGRGDVMVGSNPTLFRRWFSKACEKVLRQEDNEARFVFINAWNEWAEGAYLEPDRRHGYGYLTALRSVVRELGIDTSEVSSFCDHFNSNAASPKKKAILLHLFYYDLVDEFSYVCDQAKNIIDADIIVSVPPTLDIHQVRYIVEAIKPRKIFLVENVGRDVYPFIYLCRNIKDENYKHICKIHTKKSTHRVDGAQWRQDLVTGLLSPDALSFLEDKFFPDDDAAFSAPETSFLSLGNGEYTAGNYIHYNNLMQMFDLRDHLIQEFVAGTMFWCRFQALTPVIDCGLSVDDFGVDLGQVDGTLAHAFERVFSMVATKGVGKVVKVPSAFGFNIKRPI
ncbi:glycoside hydrolase family 99-like domain-containing protein [Rhizobium sp. ICMP 5592]|uniref:glycoside hydrolase family 99-like domain-containing protein n=1 Tax=Rhizobium sp. ICMP 5592 TaxID=2292445 RepID=UPI001886559E|nr:glycoside hydrolase family 99-like domain-containing protein [Rhizobium sp. ICMP 5592]